MGRNCDGPVLLWAEMTRNPVNGLKKLDRDKDEGVSDLPVPISWTFMYNDDSARSSLFVYTKL